MTELPQAFLSQMAAQLKGEMAAFLRTYDEGSRISAVCA